MPPFRVGKPRIKLGYAQPATYGIAEQIMRWDLLVYEDPPGWWDPAVPERVSIERTGLYLATYCVDRTAVTSTSILAARLMVNDDVKVANFRLNSAAGQLAGGSAVLLELVAGDFLVVRTQAATGTGSTATLGTGTHLSVARVGPERWV